MHKWILSKNIDIKSNSMIIQNHKRNKQILKSIDNKHIADKDIDV